MAFADKYREKASRTLKNVVDKRKRNESGLLKLKQEEEAQRKSMEERKRKLRESEAQRENELVQAWGVVVMSSGFEDEYPENFGLLDVIIRDAMKRIKDDPSVMDRYLEMLKDATAGEEAS